MPAQSFVSCWAGRIRTLEYWCNEYVVGKIKASLLLPHIFIQRAEREKRVPRHGAKQHGQELNFMYSFKELKKAQKETSENLPVIKMALMGDCATQLLATAIRGYGAKEGFHIDLLDTDYNQIKMLTMDPTSEVYQHNPEYILIQMCTEKLFERYCQTPMQDRTEFAKGVMTEIQTAWDNVARFSTSKVIQFDFVEVDDRILGNYGLKVESSFLFQLRKLNYMMMEQSAKEKHIYLASLAQIQNQMGRKQFFDEKYYYSAKVPISLTALPFAAKQVVDIIKAQKGRIKKCVVLDLDNTLWGGVIGDDGLSGIQIGELGAGHAFTDFQLWLRELKNRGIILTVCSKNNEETAKEPFEKHPEMVLRLEDISMFVANWEDKANNIKRIQQTLNLGMDSFVFIDDNPFERNMVRSLIPEITVPELPEDPAEYLGYMQSLNLFETASYSEEDQNRTKQYQAEIGRAILQQQYASVDEYLKSLEMVAEAKPFDAFHVPRIAQLTQRSNQFNLRTVRYSEDDIQRIAEDDHYITLYFTLKDKFGDHGLISVVILEKQDAHTLFVNTWLMSCRVLKRGMEEFVINTMIDRARRNGYNTVIGEYIKTPKNAMVEHIFEKMGFQKIADTLYQADVESYCNQKTYIQEA